MAAYPDILTDDSVVLGLDSVSKDEAITAAGRMLVGRGLVDDGYVDAMHRREATISTYMGNGVAMPHGTFDARDTIHGTGIVVMQYPDGVDWGDEKARLVVGLAATGEDHVGVLSQLAEVLLDEDLCEVLSTTDDPQTILDALRPEDE